MKLYKMLFYNKDKTHVFVRSKTNEVQLED